MPVEKGFMKLFGEALEKRAFLCYTFRVKYAENVAKEW